MVSLQRAISDIQLAHTQSTATQSARWDMLGADYGTLLVAVGPQVDSSAATFTLSVVHSDTTTLPTVTVVADQAVTSIATNPMHVRYNLDARTLKRYVFLKVTPATHTTHDPITITAIMLKSRLEAEPSSSAAMVSATTDVNVVA